MGGGTTRLDHCGPRHPGRVYPRVGGGTGHPRPCSRLRRGLSPRVRGNRGGPAVGRHGHGLSPRGRGNPTSSRAPVKSRDVGLSPRVRGNLLSNPDSDSSKGSIPASAGEPSSRRTPSESRWVYPRECGGTRWASRRSLAIRGLSPRVRGNPSHTASTRRILGSIPASAGEPSTPGRWPPAHPVYPRECGGTVGDRLGDAGPDGLSPRVRGNLSLHAFEHAVAGSIPRVRGNRARRRPSGGGRGSIPASAGEPTSHFSSITMYTVYPRECGGTHMRGNDRHLPEGLSPRVRGNLRRLRCRMEENGLSPRVRGNRIFTSRRAIRIRSIPASAGEPERADCWIACKSVYPASAGNPRHGAAGHHAGRSIPASAGEPINPCPPRHRAQVYPRECGGTTQGNNNEQRDWGLSRECGGTRPGTPRSAGGRGLSPRVRGNRPPCPVLPRGCRSIPASAGEPEVISHLDWTRAVYPRECGGTPSDRPRPCVCRGLSPRVRGNLKPLVLAFGDWGSIPASAGEPAIGIALFTSGGVYPRECGGTARFRAARHRLQGLSPRVRGNPTPVPPAG